MSNQTFTYGVAQNLTANGYSKTGYNFLGWSTSSTATSATYSNGQSITFGTTSGFNTSNVTLYAVWQVGITDCSSTNKVNATTGCNMGGYTWIYGNGGNTVRIGTIIVPTGGSEAAEVSNTYCPSGYAIPTASVLNAINWPSTDQTILMSLYNIFDADNMGTSSSGTGTTMTGIGLPINNSGDLRSASLFKTTKLGATSYGANSSASYNASVYYNIVCYKVAS